MSMQNGSFVNHSASPAVHQSPFYISNPEYFFQQTDTSSYMVSQLEFQRMRMQVVLPLEIWLMVFAYIVIDERDGHDEGDMPLPIIIDNLQ